MAYPLAGGGLALFVTFSAAAQFTQWTSDSGGNGHWFEVVTTSSGISWSAARDDAAFRGGSLASVTSASKNQFLFSLSVATPSAWLLGEPFSVGPWLGGYAIDGYWGAWDSGESWDFTAWLPGEPCCGGEEPCLSYFNFTPLNPDGTSGPAPYWGDRANFAFGVGCVSYIVEYSSNPDCDSDGVNDIVAIAGGLASDLNRDSIPDSCQCLADLNMDGSVNGADLAVLLGFWGPASGAFPQADIVKTGGVDGADLAYLLGSWGQCPN